MNLVPLVLANLLFCAATASAHGLDSPRHGGVVVLVDDVNYELVVRPEGVDLFIVDHKKPVATAGMAGSVFTAANGKREIADLLPTGDNRLSAEHLHVLPGSEVVALVKNKARKFTTIRFVVK